MTDSEAQANVENGAEPTPDWAETTPATGTTDAQADDQNTGFFYGWIVVAVTALIVMITAGSRAAPGALLVDMERDTGWSTADLSLAAAIGLVAYGVAGPIAGLLAARLGMKNVTILSVVLTTVSMFMSSRITNLVMLSLWFGLVAGIAAGLVASFLGAAVANRWFVKHRGLVTGIFGAATSAGLLIFVPFYTWTASQVGWRQSLLWGAGITALLLPLAIIFFKNAPADVGTAPLGGQPEGPVAPDTDIIRRAIRRPEFWLLAATFMVCGGTSNGLVGQHFIAHARDHGFGEVTAANWLAVMGVFNFIGTIASGWLTDRHDPRRLLLIYYSFRGVSLMFLPFIHDSLSMAGFAILFGLDYIATVPPTIMLGAKLFGRHNAGVIYAWVFGAHQLGAAVAAWAAGLVRDSVGSYSWAFTTAGAIAIAAGFGALLILDPDDQDDSETDATPARSGA